MPKSWINSIRTSRSDSSWSFLRQRSALIPPNQQAAARVIQSRALNWN
ncbi:MAG TPA: hypothetical protein VGY66_26090 [Gemmataceae bacterium]|jgi:hypothetical protein|nr:hypothetical protein [Gemmataceae bacterium]